MNVCRKCNITIPITNASAKIKLPRYNNTAIDTSRKNITKISKKNSINTSLTNSATIFNKTTSHNKTTTKSRTASTIIKKRKYVTKNTTLRNKITQSKNMKPFRTAKINLPKTFSKSNLFNATLPMNNKKINLATSILPNVKSK